MFSPAEVNFVPSRTLLGFVLAGTASGGVSIFLAVLSAPYKLILVLFLIVYFGYLMKLYYLGWPGRTPVALRWNVRHKQIQLRLQDRDWETVSVIKDVAVLPYLVVLRLQVASSRRTINCCVLYDATDSDSFRRLRVFALHGARIDVSATDS